jgi:hypothetical protein
MKTLPKIDTKVRIDCETPGATIRYDTIRTKYTPAAALGSLATNGGVFGNTSTTASGFFSHFNVPGDQGTGTAGNANTGYNNNTIGNGGNHTTLVNTYTPTGTDGYFIGLLVPNSGDVTATVLQTNNGAIPWATLTGKGDGLVPGGNLTGGFLYNNVNASTGAVTAGTANVFPIGGINDLYPQGITGLFFYAGDAYQTTNETAANHYDEKLQTARRDYIVAAARKNAVDAGVNSGPLLAASSPAWEGVFKTTLLYREPAGTQGMGWLMVEGYDTPQIPSTPGFPLGEFRIMPPPPYNTMWNTYFSKQAYRLGQVSGMNGPDFIGSTQADWSRVWATPGSAATNNYIWVSWEIVSDFYQKGRSKVTGRTDYSRLQRNSFNYGAVLCTYGAITYRYRQFFDGGAGCTQ